MIFAFLGYTNLKTVTLNKNITYISDNAFDFCSRLENIIINTDDYNDFQRIKNLLPEALKNKAVFSSSELYKQLVIIQNEALNKLCFEPRTSRLFEFFSQQTIAIPKGIFINLNQYLGDDNPCYRNAKFDIDELTLPKKISDIEDYKNKVNDIADRYIKMTTEQNNFTEIKTNLSFKKAHPLDGYELKRS